MSAVTVANNSLRTDGGSSSTIIFRRGWADAVKWGDLIEGDILNQERLQSAVAQTKPDVIAHFAALAYVGESVTNPDIYYETNVVGSLNLLNAMRTAGVKKLILSSSCATYGIPEQIPISETHPQAPINPYGWSKLMMERMAIDYAAAYGLKYVILRYFNAAGASADGGHRRAARTGDPRSTARDAGCDAFRLRVHHLRR